MKTEEVAVKLVEYCKKLQFKEATEALYSPKIVSVEAHTMPGAVLEFLRPTGCRDDVPAGGVDIFGPDPGPYRGHPLGL